MAGAGGKEQAAHRPPVVTAVLGGGLAGCLGKTATAPLSRLTVLAQTSTLQTAGASSAGAGSRAVFAEGSMYGCMKHIISKEGVWALWKGNSVTCLHRFPFAAVNFTVFESCQSVGTVGGGSFLPGAIAGCTAVVTCYPLDLLRTRVMAAQGRGGAVAVALSTVQKEGLPGMYRGLGATLLLTVPSISASFGTYGILKARLPALGLSERSPGAMLLAGGLSGVAGSALTFPMDVVRRRLQMMGADSNIPQRTFTQEAVEIFRAEGPRGFWRGFGPEITKTFPMVAITFLGFEIFKGSA